MKFTQQLTLDLRKRKHAQQYFTAAYFQEYFVEESYRRMLQLFYSAAGK
jgi:hypothetical protein